MIIRNLFILLVVLNVHVAKCQTKFLALIDSNYISNKYINDSTNTLDFYFDARLQEKFNPLKPDIDLFNAGLFSAIQRERKRKAKDILTFSLQQYTICNRFLEFYLPNKFVNDNDNIEKFSKTTKKALKKIQFPKGISKVITFKIRCLKFKGNNFYYDKKDEDTDLKLFKGAKPTIKDSVKLAKIEKVPLEMFTYKQLIDYFIKNEFKRKYNAVLYGKEFSSLGCHIKVDERTLNKNKIPEIAIILIYGANRLKNIDKAVANSKRQRKLK